MFALKDQSKNAVDAIIAARNNELSNKAVIKLIEAFKCL